MKIKKILASLTLCILLCAASITPAFAADSAADRLSNATDYYVENYHADYDSAPEDEGHLTADMWSLLCLTGVDGVKNSEYSFLVPKFDTLSLDQDSYTTDYAKTILSMSMLGLNPFDYSGRDLVAEMLDLQQADGSFQFFGEPSATDTAFAIIAAEYASAKFDKKADYSLENTVKALVKLRKSDNGYNDWGDKGSVDTTGMVMIALAMSDFGKDALNDAVDFLKSTMDENACFVGEGEWDCENSCSQAMGIVGLIAAGEDISSYTAGSKNIVDAFYSFQTTDGGFLYTAGSGTPDAFSTQQGMIALTLLKHGSSEWVDTVVAATSKDKDNSSDTISTPSNNDNSDNPKTGDKFNPIIIVVVVVAVLAIAVVLIMPAITKKKESDDSDVGSTDNDADSTDNNDQN